VTVFRIMGYKWKGELFWGIRWEEEGKAKVLEGRVKRIELHHAYKHEDTTVKPSKYCLKKGK
jgi:hypothetical protein